jgi:hypothetical protein
MQPGRNLEPAAYVELCRFLRVGPKRRDPAELRELGRVDRTVETLDPLARPLRATWAGAQALALWGIARGSPADDTLK